MAKGNSVTTQMVGEAYAQGDPVATETLRETVQLLSLWLGNMIDLLEPDVIIIGGGVAPMMKPFLEEIRDRFRGAASIAGARNSPCHGLLWSGCRDCRGSGAGGGRGFG